MTATSDSINNTQPSFVLNQVVFEDGPFPSRTGDPTADPGGIPLGAIRTFTLVGSFDPPALGQSVALSQNSALFSLLGAAFGGNGVTTFDLPNLAGRVAVGAGNGPSATVTLGETYGQNAVTLTTANVPVNGGGGGQGYTNDQSSLAVEYLINVGGNGTGFDAPGMIVPYLSDVAPDGYLFANGQVLSISQYPDLYAAIGNTYGGNKRAGTFALPDLQGRTIVGAGGSESLGTITGSDSTTLTAANLINSTPINNQQPSLALTYMMYTASDGPVVPSSGAPLADTPYLGEIMAFAGTTVPAGWTVAAGQILSISSNGPLYSEIDAVFGGDGRSTFALPDLRDRDVVGLGGNDGLDQTFGANSYTVAEDALAPPTFNFFNANAQTLQFAPVLLNSQATVYDFTNNSENDYGNTEIIIARDGGVTVDDSLGITGDSTITVDGPNLKVNGKEFGTFADANGKLTIQFTDTAATATTALVNDVLQHVTYVNDSTAPPTAITFDYSFIGPDATAADASVVVNIIGVPVLNDLTTPASYSEGADPTGLAEGAFVSDAGVRSITVSITGGTFAGDGDILQCYSIDPSLSAVYDPATETLTLATLPGSSNAALGTDLDYIGFQSTSTNPTNYGADATRTLTWQVTDGNGNVGPTVTTTIDITAVNNAPSLGGVPTAANFAYSGPAVVLAPNISVTDPDNTTLAGVTVALTGGFTGDGDILGFDASGTTIFGRYTQSTGTLTLTGADTLADYQRVLRTLTFDTANADPTDHGADPTRIITFTANDGSSSQNLGVASETIDLTPCYCPGTLIRTACGQKPVEQLKVGDNVMTASGEARPVKWIGRRSYAGRFVMGRKDILPVCIKAGALDENVPKRDLWISPHHAMYLDGVLIEARDLINGVSVVQAERADRVEYFHIELDSHDVIIAEGAPSESYIDDDNRFLFHNARQYQSLYPDAVAKPVRYCAPRLDDGYEVESARRRIARRAGLTRGNEQKVGALRGYIDLASPRCIAGWAQNIDYPEAPVCLDIYVGSRLIGQALANGYREDLRRAGLGSGRHGFAFTPPAELSIDADRAEVRRSLDGAAIRSRAASQRTLRQRTVASN
ncbi:MAG: tail fiber protein [Bradyrhizobium sp.]